MNFDIGKTSTRIVLALLLNVLLTTWAGAHLMKAQHGTLNFVDNGVYMVLSLPVTAFETADQNDDGKLSAVEFNNNRGSMFDAIRHNVTLTQNGEQLKLKGIMLSPVVPHDDPKKPASQLTVMGRFALNDTDDGAYSNLYFEVDLYGKTPVEQSLEITAKRRSKNYLMVGPDGNSNREIGFPDQHHWA